MSCIRRRRTRKSQTGPLDCYLVPLSRTTTITIADDNDEAAIQTSQLSTSTSTSSSSSSSTSSSSGGILEQVSSPQDFRDNGIESYFHDRSSCQRVAVNDDWDSDDDALPFSMLLSRLARPSSQFTVTASSASSPAAFRRVMSDITNAVNTHAAALTRSWSLTAAQQYDNKKRERRRRFYQFIRARLGDPNDNTKCAYCGIREHSALHHEDEFKRGGTGVSISSPHTRLHYSPISLSI